VYCEDEPQRIFLHSLIPSIIRNLNPNITINLDLRFKQRPNTKPKFNKIFIDATRDSLRDLLFQSWFLLKCRIYFFDSDFGSLENLFAFDWFYHVVYRTVVEETFDNAGRIFFGDEKDFR